MQYTTYYPAGSHSICHPSTTLVYSFENIKGSNEFIEIGMFMTEISSDTSTLAFGNLS